MYIGMNAKIILFYFFMRMTTSSGQYALFTSQWSMHGKMFKSYKSQSEIYKYHSEIPLKSFSNNLNFNS